MRLQISELTTTRQWCAATGFTQDQFDKLLELFSQSYFELYGQTVAERHSEIEVTPNLSSEKELLFFTVFSLKAGLTYDLLARLYPFTPHNKRRQLGARTTSAGLLQCRLLIPTFENGNCSTDNVLPWPARR